MPSKYKLYRIVGVLMAIGFWVLAAGPTYAHGITPHASSGQARPLIVTSGGGCDNSSDGVIRACISVDSNFNIVGDAYINQEIDRTDCIMTITVFDDTSGFSASSTHHCGFFTGWVGNEFYGATHGHRYHSLAILFLNNTAVDSASSANHEQIVS